MLRPPRLKTLSDSRDAVRNVLTKDDGYATKVNDMAGRGILSREIIQRLLLAQVCLVGRKLLR